LEGTTTEGPVMLGVLVTFQYGDDFDRERLVTVASEARDMFEGMPGLRNKFFTIDDAKRRAVNFYAWEWEDAGLEFFSEELRARITDLYGVAPTIDFVEIVELIDNSEDSIE
jgi:hypothetical protein